MTNWRNRSLVVTLDCRGGWSRQCRGDRAFGWRGRVRRKSTSLWRSRTHLGRVVTGSISGHKSCGQSVPSRRQEENCALPPPSPSSQSNGEEQQTNADRARPAMSPSILFNTVKILVNKESLRKWPHSQGRPKET